MGNTAQHCRLGVLQDSEFAGDLEDSKSTSGGVFCIFGSGTFFPVSWMCKKQSSVSHSSTESEIISPDAGLSMDGLLALGLWDMVIEALRSNTPRLKLSNLIRAEKTSQEPEKSVRKFLESSEKPTVIYTQTSLELANPVKI